MEIASLVEDDDSIFLFGATDQEIANIRSGTQAPNELSHRLKDVIYEIKSGTFGPVSETMDEILGLIEKGGKDTPYFIAHDFDDYILARKRAEKMFT